MVIRIALVNEDEIVVRGFAAMLRPHSGALEVVDILRTDGPVDIALHDAFGGGRDRARTLPRLVADPRVGKVVVYTWNFQPWMATEVVDRGASGYLGKSLPAADLVQALVAVQAGNVVVAPLRPRTREARGDGPEGAEGLTAREAEVLSLITAGLSNHEVAERMELSINSVKSYIRSCYRKIDADSRTQAVLWGVAHGLGSWPSGGPVGRVVESVLPEQSESEESEDPPVAS